MTRPLLEQVVRRRVSSLDNVTARGRRRRRPGRGVRRAGGGGRGRRRACVRRTSSSTAPVAPRASPTSSSRRGSSRRRSARVQIDCAYASGFLPRSADDFEGSFLVCGTSPPTSFRARGGASRGGRSLDGDVGGRARRRPGHDRGRGPRVRSQPVVAGGGPARRARGPAVVGGVVPLPVQPAPALREGTHGCCRGSSRSATRRAASTPSTGRACPAPPCRPTHSAHTVREVGVRVGRAAAAVPPQGREDHRRSLGDRGRRGLPAPADERAEGAGDGPGQPLRPAGRPGHPHLGRAREVVQPGAQPGGADQVAGRGHRWWLACSRPAFPDAARPAWIIHASDRRRADLASR